jgi:hypothetical protein
MVSALIGHGFRIWLYDPIPYGFSDEELNKISRQQSGWPFLRQPLDAAREADAVLFLISPWTLESSFQQSELSVALKHHRFVPCIVHDDLDFKKLPAALRHYQVSKITERMLSAEGGGATRMQMLLDDVANMAMSNRKRAIDRIMGALSRLLAAARN